MRKCCVIVLVIMCFFLIGISCQALDVSAQSAVVMVAETNEVLYAKNSNVKLSMASTTKIMTSLLTLERGNLKQKIKVKSDMIQVEGTSMGLLEGDIVTVEGLVYGMLLQSGNDAANVAAITIGGSIDKFAALMNQRAKEIGMKNTHFVTPSGLDNENHYSTAYDMALLGSEAIKNVDFRCICSQQEASLYYGNPPYKRWLTNHNKMLRYYEFTIGIKTGFTKKSGRCLVTAAEKNGVILVAVTLNDKNDWSDHKAMLEYGFDCISTKQQKDVNLDSVKALGGKQDSIDVGLYEVPSIPMKDNLNVTCQCYVNPVVFAPIEKGEIVGNAVYSIGNKVILKVPIVSQDDVDGLPAKVKVKKDSIFKRLKKWLFNR